MKELVDRGEPVVGDSLYLFIPKVVSREKLVVKGPSNDYKSKE